MVVGDNARTCPPHVHLVEAVGILMAGITRLKQCYGMPEQIIVDKL